MASNPVFGRFDKDLSKGEYASIGQPQYGQYAQPQQPGMPGGQWSQAPAAGAAAYQQNLEDLYNSPAATSAQTRRMTMNDVIMKSLGLFAVLVAVAAGAWIAIDHNPSLSVPLWIGGAIVGLILVFVISFKKVVSPPLIVAYAVAEGLFLGAVSRSFENVPQWSGIVVQAVIATLCVFVGMYALFFSGVIKVTERSRKIFMMALLGYVLFAVVNAILVWTGVLSGFGVGGSGPWGILISVVAVGLAAYSLAVDFDSIQRGVNAGLPEKYSWLMAFGLMVTLVWLYVELLRLFARMRD